MQIRPASYGAHFIGQKSSLDIGGGVPAFYQKLLRYFNKLPKQKFYTHRVTHVLFLLRPMREFAHSPLY
jgi:hypothetical protein